MRKAFTLKWQVSFAGVLLILGFILSVQFRTQQSISGSLEYQSTEDLVTMWKELTSKQDRLQAEITDLRAQETLLAQQAAEGKSTRSNLEQDLIKMQAASGLEPVRGPGITITLSDDAPLLYLDLVDLVNELWASGAEAVAVNDRRVHPNSGMGEVSHGDSYYITFDGQRLVYPIVIKAIGDPTTLETGLTFTGGLIDNFNTLYSVYPEIEKQQELTLPGVADAVPWRYAQEKKAAVPETQQPPPSQ